LKPLGQRPFNTNRPASEVSLDIEVEDIVGRFVDGRLDLPEVEALEVMDRAIRPPVGSVWDIKLDDSVAWGEEHTAM